MLTSRAWWFLLLVFSLLGVGVVAEVTTMALLGLTLLLWFTFEWLTFSIRSQLTVRRIALSREVRDDRGPVDALWSGRSFAVRVRLTLASPFGLPHIAVADRVPFGVEQVGGVATAEGALWPEQSIEMNYRVRCLAVGRARFEGVRLEMADLQGFFYHAWFVRDGRSLRVLPVLADEDGPSPTSKRVNLLPPPGVHRLRRPGSGSELLDLRDYMPGDPPKTIAWKVSARRDRLVTKEFESEVPLRCTFLVDVSNSVRVGPPGRNALARLVEVAAAAAQANAAARDLTGLCLFDEQTATHVRPARTARHLAELLNRLTDAACLTPTQGQAPVTHLAPLTYAFAQEVYPDLMRPELNRYPSWLPWLMPRPVWLRRKPTLGDRLHGWLRPLFRVQLLLWFLVIAAVPALLYLRSPPLDLQPVLEALAEVGVLAALAAIPAVLILGFWLVASLPFVARRAEEARRKRLAALLSVQHQLGPGGVELLCADDDAFSRQMQRFLGEHNVPYSLPLYDDHGRYALRSPGKIEVLSKALLGLVGKGHDNELFVILADLFELDDEIAPLLKAVRVALARHHQVLIVCPLTATNPKRERRSRRTPLDELLDTATAQRLEQAYARVRKAFARVGVPVVSVRGSEAVGLILERMDRLRMLGRRR